MLRLRIPTTVELSLITSVALGAVMLTIFVGSPNPGYADDTGAPRLGLSSERHDVERAEGARQDRMQLELYSTPHGHWRPNWWGYYPWYTLPQTVPYEPDYYERGRTGYVPRLGLQAPDHYAWQMGLRIPEDHDPLGDSGWSGYRGVVGEALRSAQAERKLRGRNSAVELMKAGKYRAAGLELASGFQQNKSPRYPLLLTEVFVALGKHKHAELLLQTALETDRVECYLPQDMSAHFKDQETFEKLVGGIDQGKHPLLRAYFWLHSKTPEKGLDVLLDLVAQDPDDGAANTLYRHYLSRVFQDEESEKKT